MERSFSSAPGQFHNKLLHFEIGKLKKIFPIFKIFYSFQLFSIYVSITLWGTGELEEGSHIYSRRIWNW